MTNIFQLRALMVAIAAGTLFMAQAASADTLDYMGGYFGSYSGSFTITDTAHSKTLGPGQQGGAFSMKDTSGSTYSAGTTFEAWCVDIFDYISSGKTYNLVSGATFYSTNPSKATDLEKLASVALNSVTNAQKSAAFQIAIWEIVNETASSYSLGNGTFTATGTAASIADASNWLTAVNSYSGPTTQVLSVWDAVGTQGSQGTQDVAVFAPIPEPETYAMMLAGLGLMGFTMRRRTARNAG